MRDWSGLLPDLLDVICNRVSSYQDLVAFGGVCTTWRSVALEQSSMCDAVWMSLLPFPWLMLSEKRLEGSREFYNLMDDRTCTFHLPELSGNIILLLVWIAIFNCLYYPSDKSSDICHD